MLGPEIQRGPTVKIKLNDLTPIETVKAWLADEVANADREILDLDDLIDNFEDHTVVLWDRALKEVMTSRETVTRKTSWKVPMRKPVGNDMRRMMVKALKISSVAALENYVYEFNGHLYHKKDGGKIGSDLQRFLCHNLIIIWLGELEELMAEIQHNTDQFLPELQVDTEMFLNNGYVDDLLHLILELPLGLAYDKANKRFDISVSRYETDFQKPYDRRTMDIVTTVSNTICSNVQMSSEAGSNFEDGKLHYLDTKCWIKPPSDKFPLGETRF